MRAKKQPKIQKMPKNQENQHLHILNRTNPKETESVTEMLIDTYRIQPDFVTIAISPFFYSKIGRMRPKRVPFILRVSAG